MLELNLRPLHYDIVMDPHRFVVVIAGRRFFKTGMMIAKIADHLTTQPQNIATGEPLKHDIGYYAPTYAEAKEIFWERAKEELKPLIKGKPNESELIIRFVNGGRLRLYGTDQDPDKLRGRYKTLVLNDEFPYHRSGVYEVIIRPMLSDTQGEAWFVGTPNGNNHGKDYYDRGQNPEEENIVSYRYPSTAGGYITQSEVDAAARDMTPTKHRQEYYAEFIGLEGRVVLDWSYANTDLGIQYQPGQRIYVTCDFNVDPMCWGLAHRINGEYLFFDEIAMRYTNVEKAALELAERYRHHKAFFILTGDSSGKSRNVLAKDLSKTAYPQITDILIGAGIPREHVATDIRSANPPIRDRIDAFNRMVKSGDGIRRLKINPYKCPRIVYTMENARYIPGSSVIYEPTEKDVTLNPDALYVPHMLDAVSYLIERYDPIPKHTQRPQDQKIVAVNLPAVV